MTKSFENISEFEELFKEYFNPLVNFVNRYLNNFENSREVVQMTFMKLWENRNNFEIRNSTKSYVYQTAKNTMIDFVRKYKNHMNSFEIENALVNDVADKDSSYLDPYLLRSAIERCLTELKPKNREIFELNKFEGLTYEEIADYLQISKRSVEDNVAKTLKFLKEELKNHPDFFD